MPQQGSLSGARKLRIMRERRKLKQLDFDFSDVITQANYSKIERGISTPSREKLQAILEWMQATFNEQRDVLSAFGYLPPYPIPDEAEIQVARDRCRPVLDEVRMPAYLMDFLTRFLDWNDCFAKLLGDQETSDALDDLKNKPLFETQFHSRVRIAGYIGDMEPYLLTEMQAIRERLAPFSDERWYDAFVADLCQEPNFNHYWQATAEMVPNEEPVTEFAASIVEPVKFTIPGEDTELHFYANVDPVNGDDRFRLVYLIASDSLTMRQVERWVAENAGE